MKLSPDDLLWLAILEEEPKLFYMTEKGIKNTLKKRGFPFRIIDAFIRRRAILMES
jgi:hypothetical protein